MKFVLSKIAFRNLSQHKSKTIIIGVLVMVGIAVLIVGNSVLLTIQKGIEKNYVEKYSGSVFVIPDAVEVPGIIVPSGVGSSGLKDAPKIDDFDTVQAYVESLSEVKDTTPKINTAGMMQFGENGQGFGILFGVDPDDYMSMFPQGVNIIDGEFLKEGEEGIVLSKTVVDMINSTSSEKVGVGNKILVSMISNSGTKIRELKVVGIHDMQDSSFDISMVCFTDPTTARILNGMLLNSEEDLNLGDDEKNGLGSFDEDDFFGSSDSLFDDDLISDSVSSDTDLFDILGDTSERDKLSIVDPSAWNLLLIKLNNVNDSDKVVKTLNNYFDTNNLEMTAYDWTDGAGMSATMANIVELIFYIILVIIGVVVVIVIMNTLVVSISERTAEIGTMRALGARKNFIMKMIGLETLFITLVFGILGVLLGCGVLGILGKVGIQANGMFMKILLGGDVFTPLISGSSIIWSIIIISLISVLSSLYPVIVALRISPREAMEEH